MTMATVANMADHIVWAVPAFLLVMTVIVFFHELGHYLVGRWAGVKVESFSLGFGPELAHRIDKHGTRWRLAAFPLGGYVKFYGDENAASAADFDGAAKMTEAERSQTLQGQPVWKRSAVVAAGPIANFILAIVIFAGSNFFLGRMVIEPRVGAVLPGSAAEQAQLRKGDVILSVDGEPTESFADIARIVGSRADSTIRIRFDRGGVPQETTATPTVVESTSRFGTFRRGRLGIEADAGVEPRRVRYGLVQSVSLATSDTWFVIERTGAFIKGLFVGEEDPRQISGVIGMADMAGSVARVSLESLFWLAAVLSISIGIMNLLPIPMLDGGHLVYYAIEAARGRPLSERAQEIGFRFGMIVVLALMAFSIFNDIALRLPFF